MMVHKYKKFIELTENNGINYTFPIEADTLDELEDNIFHKISTDVELGIKNNSYQVDEFIVNWSIITNDDLTTVSNSIRNKNTISDTPSFNLKIDVEKRILESKKEEMNLLYHSTDVDSLLSILMQNSIACSTYQEIDDKMVMGTSFTKNDSFIYNNSDVTIIIDSDRIKNKFNMTEIDFFKTKFGMNRKKIFKLDTNDEAEVFVYPKTKSTKSIKASDCLYAIRLNKNIKLDDDIVEIINSDFPNIKIFNNKNKDITRSTLNFKNKSFNLKYF